MAAVSLEDPAQAKEAEIEKAPPLAFGAVVKQQYKWQVCMHTLSVASISVYRDTLLECGVSAWCE